MTAVLLDEDLRPEVDRPGSRARSKIMCVVAKQLPNWYFDMRHTKDLPALMRMVKATLDTEEMQREFSFKRYEVWQ